MIFKKFLFILTVLPSIIIIGFVFSSLLWVFLDDKPGKVILLDSGKTDNLQWYFANTKIKQNLTASSPEELKTLKANNSFLVVSDVSSYIKENEKAAYYADLIKETSSKSSWAFFDGSSLSDNHHGLYRSIMEDFLKIHFTGWSFIYVRTEKQLEKLSIKIREKKPFKPVIIFTHESGEIIVLESKKDYSGKAPQAELFQQKAELNEWTPLYTSINDGKEYGSIDLHLTEEGIKKLDKAGIQSKIPLAFFAESDYSKTCFFAINIQDSQISPGSLNKSFKSWYMEKIALFKTGSADKLFWKIFIPLIKSFNIDKIPEISQEPLINYNFKLSKTGFLLSTDSGTFEDFYIKGVNLGPAVPGRWFTEFPVDEHLYIRWFGLMKEMNINVVRIYTLLPPSFYRSLRDFNLHHQKNPLFLIQEIWPEEHPIENNLLEREYNITFMKEIKMNIDALHGKGKVPFREGRAWGDYNSDISPWLGAYIIGREIEPDEVQATDTMNNGFIYSGEYLSVVNGSPTESWLASVCDYAALYEQETYLINKPLGIVSWPTLDPLKHQTEWNDPELAGREPFNDKAVLNINHFIITEKFQEKFFGAYHIYPNYPDFMNNQESYASYTDSQGTFRYGGYLKEFIKQHSKYPALVAEYGLSTSSATAHINPDGYNHGGLSELQQAEGIKRMADAIKREGYAGGIIFEWIDEWAKKTWTTEPYMIPYDRQVLWQNALDPEQNYGIVAMLADSKFDEREYTSGDSEIKMSTWGTESHLYIQMNVPDFEKIKTSKLVLGFDTYDRLKGSFQLPGIDSTKNLTGMEFMLSINLNDIKNKMETGIYALKSYNIGLYNYSSAFDSEQEFLPIKQLVNRGFTDIEGNYFSEKYADPGILHFGDLNENYNNIHISNDQITIRIPWGLLNVSDPSSGFVLDDPGEFSSYPERDQLKISKSESILIYGFIEDEKGINLLNRKLTYSWKNWDIPQYRERPKEAYSMLTKYFE
ncbi:MAG: hypothetical protein PF518_11065 [Spirochaetaceae bacterium]|jgi:hypothetical protein|nr:hypothetical protein [Spirochaetaceae bacterium]